MIIPAILEKTFNGFEEQINKLPFSSIIQIDVMDGEFVDNKSFEEIEKIDNLKLSHEWELHLMVNHPLQAIDKWKKIKNIKRVIFHIESEDHPQEVIKKIKENHWQVGIAINPETDNSEVLPYISQIDEVLFMTVHPGQQGASFLPEMKEKIMTMKKLLETKNADVIIAADGAIKKNNIQEIKNWGVENFCIGSAVTLAPNPKEAYEELLKLI